MLVSTQPGMYGGIFGGNIRNIELLPPYSYLFSEKPPSGSIVGVTRIQLNLATETDWEDRILR